jgi:hypothetical protein
MVIYDGNNRKMNKGYSFLEAVSNNRSCRNLHMTFQIHSGEMFFKAF